MEPSTVRGCSTGRTPSSVAGPAARLTAAPPRRLGCSTPSAPRLWMDPETDLTENLQWALMQKHLSTRKQLRPPTGRLQQVMARPPTVKVHQPVLRPQVVKLQQALTQMHQAPPSCIFVSGEGTVGVNHVAPPPYRGPPPYSAVVPPSASCPTLENTPGGQSGHANPGLQGDARTLLAPLASGSALRPSFRSEAAHGRGTRSRNRSRLPSARN